MEVTIAPRHVTARRWATRALVVYVPLAVVLVAVLFPFYWMVVTSFKPTPDIFSLDVNPFYTLRPTLDHYVYLFEKTYIVSWFFNTMSITLGSTAISLVCAIPAGYALARLRFPGAAALGTLIFAVYLVPHTLLFIPMVQVMNTFGLVNTRWTLMLAYPTFLIPFGTWLLTGYFRGIPREIEECALVDGASKIVAMLQIALPLALPGVLSVFIFSFTLSWNEFLYALVLINDTEIKTMPVAIVTELIHGDMFMWGQLMAASLLASVPVALFYSFFVDYFVSGLTAGAVKG